MSKYLTTKNLLIFILFLAFILRVVSLTRADMQGDETTYSFRAIGYLDLLNSNQQTTPVQWFGEMRWWFKLSFHDHPPLVFLIQHIFFLILGVSTVVARLPFVLAGVFSVYLLFLIAKKLFNERIGLVSAFILAILNYHIWISRIGYLEGILIFFVLLNFYFFIKLLNQPKAKNYVIFGLTLGLAFLCKYSMLFLLPAYFFFLFVFYRKVLWNKKILLSALIFLIVISPVILYNVLVYKYRGHLDLQFSQLLGMDLSKDWSLFAKGQGERNIWQNFTGVFSTLSNALNIYVFSILVISFLFVLFRSLQKSFNAKKQLWLLLITLLSAVCFFTFTGPALRFLPVMTPFIALLIGYLIYYVYRNLGNKNFKKIFIIIFALFFLMLIIKDINTQQAKSPATFYNPALRQENYGFRQLDKYLFDQNIDFTNSIVIFDGRLNWFCRTWYFYLPVNYYDYNYMSVENFINTINTKGENYFKDVQGFDNYYFIKAENTILEPGITSNGADVFEQFLTQENGLSPELIYRDNGQVAFKVYYFN